MNKIDLQPDSESTEVYIKGFKLTSKSGEKVTSLDMEQVEELAKAKTKMEKNQKGIIQRVITAIQKIPILRKDT